VVAAYDGSQNGAGLELVGDFPFRIAEDAGIAIATELVCPVCDVMVGAGIAGWAGYTLYKNAFRGAPDSTPSDGKQVRRYGPDGYPQTDVDTGHDHGAGDPHAHDWRRPLGGARRLTSTRGRGGP